jgi:predicted DsbA family dithiol-disulfide isomerase
LSAYFSEGRNPSSREVLLAVAEQAGLDVNEAAAILDADTWRDEVRQQQQFYLSQGIHSVPAVIINDRQLIQGGQPPEVFEQALRQIAAES